MKKLDLTSLRKALSSIKKAIERYGREPEDEESRSSERHERMIDND